MDRPSRDPLERFCGRVDDYARYRPRYPREILELLEREIGLEPQWWVADVGSGTGISTEPFLENGNLVFAVEPNAEMRAEAERRLGNHPRFRSVAGRTEATGLEGGSVDLVVAAQAFHWFEPRAAHQEFVRILRPGGWVTVLWYTRLTDTTPFLRAYEELLREFGTDYERVRHDRLSDRVIERSFDGAFRRRTLHTEQVVDFDGLRGRLLSSSYVPAEGEPGVVPMLQRLEEIFRDHAADGTVRFEHDLDVYWGHPGHAGAVAVRPAAP